MGGTKTNVLPIVAVKLASETKQSEYCRVMAQRHVKNIAVKMVFGFLQDTK